MESKVNEEIIRLCVEIHDGMMPGAALPSGMCSQMYRGGGGSGKPMFFLLTYNEDVHIVISGASEPMDFVQCVDYSPTPFHGGYVHHGVYESAQWIISQARSYIDKCTGRIICTGHSYGGALSTMISTILVFEEKRDAIAVSFAPLPSLSQSLARAMDDRIVSFSYNNDIVPRLTQPFIANIVKMLFPQGVNEMQIQSFLMPIFGGIMQQAQNFGFNVSGSQINPQNFLPQIARQIANVSYVPKEQQFGPGGKIYHIVMNDGIPTFTRVSEPPPLPQLNMMTMMSYVMDHNGQFYFDAVLLLDELP